MSTLIDNPIYLPPVPLGSGGTDWYISPTGSDSNNGLSTGAPKKTFANTFASMASGDQLWLMDGTYGTANNTGYISYLGTNSAQPPSGLSLARSTRIKAINPGSVTVNGGLWIGRSFAAQDYIEVHGITFIDVDGTGAGSLYRSNYSTIKNCGFNGSFGIGTSDHDYGNSYNLVEDVWIWAAAVRVIAINYRASKNVWRRVVVRGDGCSTTECVASGAPNVGISVYDCSDVYMENVFVVDRVLDPAAIAAGNPYADFATAQHTANTATYLGRHEWLGCASIHGPDSGFVFEADNTIAGNTTWTLENCLVVGANIGGFNIGASGTTVIRNATAISSTTNAGEDGFRIAPSSPGTSANNIIVKGFDRALNSSITPQYVDTYGWGTVQYNQTTPTIGVHTGNPTADGTPASIKYPVRVEANSALKGVGNGVGGANNDIGANIFYRYGADGSRWGDANVSLMSNTSLWPWPNEGLIKSQFGSSNTRGFANTTAKQLNGTSNVTLTSYVWEYLGNQIPSTIYGSTPVITGGNSAPLQNSTATITGTSFGASQGTGSLVIGGVTQTVTSWSDTSISYTVNRGTNLNGVAVNAVVTDTNGNVSNSYALDGFAPPLNWLYVTLADPNPNTQVRLTSVANNNISYGDQLEWNTSNVTIYNDATFSATTTTNNFLVRVGVPGYGWTAPALEDINSHVFTASAGSIIVSRNANHLIVHSPKVLVTKVWTIATSGDNRFYSAYPTGLKPLTLTASTGSIVVTGVAAILRAPYRLTAAAGSFTITGNANDMIYMPAILDAFTGTNGTTLTAHGGWSTMTNGVDMVIQGNAGTGGTGGGNNISYRNSGNFGPNTTVGFTITTKPADGELLLLLARLVQETNLTTVDGYALQFAPVAGTDTLQFQVVTNGALTPTGAAISQEITAGDAIAFKVRGGSLQAYYKPTGSTWRALGSPVSNATYSAAGKIGIYTNSNVVRVDDFIGGTI